MSRSWGPERPVCERIDAWFEDYLDGELDSAECSELEAHVATCAPCREELALARSVVGGLRSLPAVARPPSSAANRNVRDLEEGARASRTTADEDAALGVQTRRAWPPPPAAPTVEGSVRSKRSPWGHPLLQAAALLLLLSAVWLAMGDTPFGPAFQMERATGAGGNGFTEAEIREAEEDLKIALSYFGGLAEKAGLVVRDEVLAERVVEPTRRAFRRIGDFGADVGASAPSATSSEDPSQEKERP